ncbi:HNH endonuclease [Endozoicomonadaceae bacterium StTr2]
MQDTEFSTVVDAFDGKSFSTQDFIDEYTRQFSISWQKIVAKYGEGGKGAGRHYSANSRIAHWLDQKSKDEQLEKLDYRKAPEGWGSPIIRYWAESRSQYGGTFFPEELESSETVIEGARKQVTVNRYERDRSAREKCIEKWGIRCFVCDFDFESRYGSLGAGFIHIHHLKPLSEIGEAYELNPAEDLRPLCPNCHAMVHRHKPALSVEALRDRLQNKATEQE